MPTILVATAAFVAGAAVGAIALIQGVTWAFNDPELDRSYTRWLHDKCHRPSQ